MRKRKIKFRKFLSGMMAAITILASVLPAGMVYAEEAVPKEYPKYEEVKDLLEPDEVVEAKDIELAYASVFNPEKDFQGIEIPDENKVKVTLHEAKTEDGTIFTTEKAADYKAVYYVEPVSGNPAYQISRWITVLEPVTEMQTNIQPETYASSETEIQSETSLVQETQTELVVSDTEIQTELIIPDTEIQTELVTPDTEIQTELIIPDTEVQTDNTFPESNTNEMESEIHSEVSSEAIQENKPESEAVPETIVPETELEDFPIELPMDMMDVFENEMETEIITETIIEEVVIEEELLLLAEESEESEPPESETEIVDETPVPNKFKLVNSSTFCPVPSKYAVNPSTNYAATRLRTVVFYASDGSTVKRDAYCMQPNLETPKNGTYDMDSDRVLMLESGSKEKSLAKCLYYMYGGPAWGKTIDYADGSGSVNLKSKMENYGCTGKNNFFAVTHYVLAYFYVGASGNWNSNSGIAPVMNSDGESMIKTLAGYIKKLPNPNTELSKTSVTTTFHSSTQKNVSETVTYKSIDENTATITLPVGIFLVNETAGTSSTGTVKIVGGTKFHLEASSNISGTGTYTLECKYPVDFNAFALKTSGKQDIGFSYYSGDKSLRLTVEWPNIAKVAIVKSDERSGETLAGAVYGVYSDQACTNLITQMPPTDANGTSSVELTKTQDTVYLKEISVPSGYLLNTIVYPVSLVAGDTVTQKVTNKEQLGNLTIYKEGEVFTGIVSGENGITFQYETRRQKGAVYNVYAAEDIKTPTGSIVYKAGTKIAENLTTGENGSVTLKNLHMGSYNVTEVQAPQNFYNSGETKTVVLSYAGQTAEAAFANTTFKNERQKTEVTIIKIDKNTKSSLVGGIFGLYAGEDLKTADGTVAVKKGTLIEKVTTERDGKASFHSDLPIGHSYEIREIQAPAGYIRNAEDAYNFQFEYTNDKDAVVAYNHTFTNVPAKAVIHLQKIDAETNAAQPQGDASLAGAVYGLYAKKDIVHPDGKTGVLYKAGEQVGTLTTDINGKASISNLYLGEYFVKEITPSIGYLKDEEEHDLICNYEGDMTAVVERSCTSLEQVKKQPFQIIKAANNGKTDADLLKGAGFTAYLESTLSKKADGSYDFSSTESVVLGSDGTTEIFTDERGYAVSIPLPYGTYVVRETTTPHNYAPVEDFIVRITEHKPNQPQVWRVLLDDEFEAKLKIIKKDDETKKTVLAAGAEFKVYDLENQKYVEQVTTYPTTITHKSYFTDADGYLILPQNLKIGKYRIEEVTAPEGYTLNATYVEIMVDSNTFYQTDSISGDAIIEVVYEDHPVKGELTVVKRGEALSGYENDFTYKVQNLTGAVFEVYAAEDIYTADFQKDDTGKRILEYAKDELVAELTTDESGKATLKGLPLGIYRVTEKKAPEGFVQNTEEQYIEFVYADQNTPIISKQAEFINDRQKVEISVLKKDAENETVLAGAEFALYTKEDVKSGDTVIVKADTMLTTAVSNEEGKAIFEQDLPFGTYYVKETKAPAGFVSSDTIIEVTASYQGQDVEMVRLEEVFSNQPTVTEFTKADLTTSVELDGATLTVLDKEGTVIETWTSVKDQPHVIKRLHVGETYILREEFAPYGYLKAEEVAFTVVDTADVQKVEMKDTVPVGRILINKQGEFFGEVTWNDMVAGALESAFGYVTGSLNNVTFEVYALEDIKAADGVSDDYYKKDELVTTIVTDELGYARADDLPLGKYYVVEKETADGFVLAGEPREIDLTYRDQDTPVVTYDETWQNNRQKAKVAVLKKEKDSERVLAGAVFALCVKEDIENAEGKVVLKADTVIEQKATDNEGKILFTADLPVGESYYVKEVQAAPGFVTTEEIQEFTFEYAGADQAEVTFEFVFENEATTLEFTKSDFVNGGEVVGAKLQVTDKEGNLVDEWISGTESHIIKELVVGETYTLTERVPANGYVTAESIVFTVDNTTEIQKVDMKDDVTKVLISKTDMTDGSPEVEGAKLYILDENDMVMDSWISGKEPHYIEMLPIGKYTLLEESAPLGYIISERVPFEVKDTGEIQNVQMVDDTAKGKVILNKTDKETGKPMKGVEFTLYDNNGKALERLVTDSAGHAESKLYPIATFKDGAYTDEIVYMLKETKTVDGYVLDKTEHKVVFEYVDDKTPVVEYQIELTNEKVPVTESTGVTYPDAPKTGDETNIMVFVVTMLLATGCFATLLMLRKKNK